MANKLNKAKPRIMGNQGTGNFRPGLHLRLPQGPLTKMNRAGRRKWGAHMGYTGGMGSWKVQAPLVGQLPPSSSGSLLCVNWSPVLPKLVTFFFLKDFIYLFLEREEGREKERERNVNVWLPLTWPPLGTWPATQACALTGNRTGDFLVHSLRSVHWAIPARAACDF